jgi:ABC-type multidrug transport system fused ATPase/permease subunit
LDQFKFLKKHASKNRKKLVIALTCLGFVSVSNLVYPWLFKILIDHLVGDNSKADELNIPFLTVLLSVVMILSTIFGYYTNILMQELGYRLRNDVRNEFFKSLLYKPLSFFKNEQVGGLTSRATEDIGKLQGLFTGLVAPVFQNVLFITGCLLLMLQLNPPATGIVTAIILSAIPVIYFFSKKVKVYSAESQREHASANAIMDETLTGIRDVKAFVLETLRLKKYSLKSEAAFEREMHSTRYQAKTTQSVFVIVSLLLLLIFYFGVSGISSWSPGSAAAFYFYAYSLTMAFLTLGKAYGQYNSITGANQRITELIGDEVGNMRSRVIINGVIFEGKIEFRNVSFGYSEEKQVLKNISFTVNKGEWYLITGPSGSGKSTIANLLLGFYEPESGSVLLDDIGLNEIDKGALRSNIGYVGQEAVLFEGTIRENILISGTQPEKEVLEEILKTSMADGFINELPRGLDTNIAERGVTLSAGQRSRIAVARALVIDPAILILDEANSMLDEELETELWKNLYEHRKNRTTIIFSHHTEAIPKVYKHFQIPFNH